MAATASGGKAIKHVTVVGGGTLGAQVAWRLLQAGRSVGALALSGWCSPLACLGAHPLRLALSPSPAVLQKGAGAGRRLGHRGRHRQGPQQRCQSGPATACPKRMGMAPAVQPAAQGKGGSGLHPLRRRVRRRQHEQRADADVDQACRYRRQVARVSAVIVLRLPHASRLLFSVSLSLSVPPPPMHMHTH